MFLFSRTSSTTNLSLSIFVNHCQEDRLSYLDGFLPIIMLGTVPRLTLSKKGNIPREIFSLKSTYFSEARFLLSLYSQALQSNNVRIN